MIDVYIRATNEVDNVRIFHSEGSGDRYVKSALEYAKSVSKYDIHLVDVWVSYTKRVEGGKMASFLKCVGKFKKGVEWRL